MKESGIDWIGQIPEEWEVTKLKYALLISNGKDYKDIEVEEGGYPVIGSGGVFARARNYMYDGDVVLLGRKGTIDKPLFYSGKFWTVDTMFYSTALNGNDIKFMYYSSLLIPFSYYSTATALPSMTQSDLNNHVLCLPSISEQQKIADFLDKKTAQLDTVKSLLEEQIQKLKDYRASLIYETVTKGLDKTVPMKDSGIDWIGQVPEGWKIGRVKDAFKLRSEKNFRPIEEVQLLSLYTEFGVFPHGDREEKGNKAVSTEGYKIVYKKDIVVNIILAWMGSIGISEYDGVTSPAYDIYEPLEGVCSKFFHYLFRTEAFAGQCYKYGKGIMKMRWRTYSDDFKTIEIPIPDYNSQVNIVKFLDNKIKIINQLIDIKQEQIENINKQRQTLIYDYVTGKRRV